MGLFWLICDVLWVDLYFFDGLGWFLMDWVVVCLIEVLLLEDVEYFVILGFYYGILIGLLVLVFDESDCEEFCDVVVGGCILGKVWVFWFDFVYCVVLIFGFLFGGLLLGYSFESGVNGRGCVGCFFVMMGDCGGVLGCCVLCGLWV